MKSMTVIQQTQPSVDRDRSPSGVKEEWQLTGKPTRDMVLDVESGIRSKEKDASRVRKSKVVHKAGDAAFSNGTTRPVTGPTTEKKNQAKSKQTSETNTDVASLWRTWQSIALSMSELPIWSW